jgi:predicted Zn finger-like uncharacterized protein
MGIKATCHCGAQFMAKLELAGQTVKCPTCGQAFQVPNPASAANRSTFQVACPCGRTYQVQAAMAGRPVRCKACSQQFVVPQAPVALREAGEAPITPTPDPLESTGPLDNLGDLSSFDGSLGGTMPAARFPAQAPASSASGKPRTIARPTRKKKAGNKTAIVSIVLGSLVVLAIIGIAVGTFVFFPSGSRYATPEAVWEALKNATESKDWKTLYNTMTPETRDRMVGGVALMVQMGASADESLAAIKTKYGLLSIPDISSPAEMGQMFAQMQQQIDLVAESIEDKEAFFIEVMDYMTQKGEEMQDQLGNQQMSMMNASQELKDVVVNGDNARGVQSVSMMGKSFDVPIEFRRINDSWLIHQPGLQEMTSQGAGSNSPS